MYLLKFFVVVSCAECCCSNVLDAVKHHYIYMESQDNAIYIYIYMYIDFLSAVKEKTIARMIGAGPKTSV